MLRVFRSATFKGAVRGTPMESLQYRYDLPCLTTLRPAGGEARREAGLPPFYCPLGCPMPYAPGEYCLPDTNNRFVGFGSEQNPNHQNGTKKKSRTYFRGIHGLPKVSLRSAMPYDSTPCGRLTTPSDTPYHRPMEKWNGTATTRNLNFVASLVRSA
jgi:hypothetical protein